MGQAQRTNYSPGLLLRRLLPYFSLDRMALLFDLYQALRVWLIQQGREGIYEIFDYESTLELVDP